MSERESRPLSLIELHVLLAIEERPLHGYAIMKAAEAESRGAVRPEIGSLYRVLARLSGRGLIEEVAAPEGEESGSHPGRERRYYALTREGRGALREEVARMNAVLQLARSRDLLSGSSGG